VAERPVRRWFYSREPEPEQEQDGTRGIGQVVESIGHDGHRTGQDSMTYLAAKSNTLKAMATILQSTP
jgi:hypothetical protein